MTAVETRPARRRPGPVTGATRWAGEAGSGGGEALEVLLVATAMLVFLLALVAAGRFTVADSKVDAAAAAAARAASQQPTPDLARTAATAQALAALAGAGMACQGGDIASVDTTGFAAPPGTPASVVVTVSCTVGLSDLGIPGLPGAKTVTGRAASPIDEHRERP